MTQQKDWKDHPECLVRLLIILTENVMRHDSQEWTVATVDKARETGTTIATASATKANSHGAKTEIEASVGAATSGSNATGRAGAMVRDTTSVTGVIGQMAVDTAAATGTAT
jgi:hypothetical protein